MDDDVVFAEGVDRGLDGGCVACFEGDRGVGGALDELGHGWVGHFGFDRVGDWGRGGDDESALFSGEFVDGALGSDEAVDHDGDAVADHFEFGEEV